MANGKKSANVNAPAGKRRGSDVAMDVLILALVLVANHLIRRVAIPYIDRVYHYSAETMRIEFGLEGLWLALRTASPGQWFRTTISSLELPEYRWYTALLLAAMVQVVTADVRSYLRQSWLRGRRFAARLLAELAIGALFTEFMLALMTLALLTICPQNLPPLFQLIEVAAICLPALVHALLRRRGGDRRFPAGKLALSLASVVIIYFAIDHTVLCSLLLFAISCFSVSRSEGEKRAEDPDGSSRAWARILGLAASAAWIGLVCAQIYPVVEQHMPVVNRFQEVIRVSAVEAKGYDAWFLREDGAAVDRNNEVYLENVRQIAVCDSNKFFLGQDGRLWACAVPGAEPVGVMEDVRWIDAFDDVLVAVDGAGDLWAFGDMTRYQPETGYCAEPRRVAEGLGLVRADIGKGHILMLDGDGNLYGMGENTVGELGTGETSLRPQGPVKVMSGIVDAKAGVGVSYALDGAGTMYAWGRNDVGQLGTGVKIEKYNLGEGYAVNVGLAYSATPLALDFSDAPIVQVAAGAECGFALDSEGRMWAWGKNISRESIADPHARRSNVRWLGDNKYQSGIIDQNCYYVDTDALAYVDYMGQVTTSENEVAELVFDESNWFPEPIEVVNSRLLAMLEGLDLFRPEEVEAEPETYTTAVRAPREADATDSIQFYDGHAYRIVSEFMYTKNAEVYCEGMGGHLVTVTSAGEHDFVTAIINRTGSDYGSKYGSNFGTGLRYDGGWQWITGEPTDYVESLGVTPAFADPKGEGYINTSGKMNVGMMVKHPFVCEWDHE